MPRQRKSRERHQLQGGYRPSRHGVDADREPLMAEPPVRFTEAQKQAWRDLVDAGKEFLAASDVLALELAAGLLAESREPTPMQPARIAQLARLLARLGLDPTARGAVDRVRQRPGEADPFFEFDRDRQ